MSDDANGRKLGIVTPRRPIDVRLMENETRLMRDELRLARDETRLARDEARITLSEHQARANRMLAIVAAGVGGGLVIALVALVVAVSALERDVNAIQQTAPARSVNTASLQDASVTGDKLAADSVSSAALAAGSVGRAQLAPNAVTGRSIRPNSVKGSDVAEGTLGTVPSATGAAKLGNLPASAYVAWSFTRKAASRLDAKPAKGPLAAHCPSGTRAISGGIAIAGSAKGVSVVQSEPNGGVWLGRARAAQTKSAWQLIVTAVCARPGK